ncbi:glycosyl hydrolase family 28-related protein [Aquirhabdus parva]|uniref:Rhamnogalacturonase A/B/Epimerase-like pectate lyase domain-containing protein n=1 Tax=Aquirhabdus parva TaxID=2283318 RepID=A0A345P9B9_9GAMM|nr:glycosyl hydrolase family 28-related protein [Aquirhabdus parva]AXI03878.1 hypothetical protein HYN46_14145 [Aquirhabdus parva]
MAIINVKNAPYNAVGDGVADDTTAIQNAISAVSAGGAVYIPSGNYKISAVLNVTGQGVTIYGDNQYKTLILQTVANVGIFNNTGLFNAIQDLAMIYSGVTPTTGAIAINSSGANTNIKSVIIRNCDIGIRFSSGSAQMATEFQILNYETTGLLFDSVNDIYCSQFVLNAGDLVRGRSGGVNLYNQCEAINLTDGDVLLGVYSLIMDSPSNSIAARPAYCSFTAVYFDSAAQGSTINNSVESTFVSSWFSGGRTGTGFAGLTLNTTDSITFNGTRFFNNGASGCVVSSNAKRTVFGTGTTFESNSVTAGSGKAFGLDIQAGNTDTTVIGCIAQNRLYNGLQAYGIRVGASTDRIVIQNNNLNGNINGGIQYLSTGVENYISGNVGFRSQNQGFQYIPSGSNNITVNHGLAVTPNPQDISFSRTGAATGESYFWLDTTSVNATSFTMHTNVNVTANLPFVWQVHSLGS